MPGILLKCQKCNYEWEYNGTKRFYASCPDCHTSVNINTNRIEAFST